MPYISRDSDGVITEIHQFPPSENSKWLEIDNPEVAAFLQQLNTLNKAKLVLADTDHEMVRVIEDLVDLLIAKQLFTYTELPKVVQQKLGTRKKIREEIQVFGGLIDNDEKIL